jgi:hypothetical protein
MAAERAALPGPAGYDARTRSRSPSQGCDIDNLAPTGGAGLFYCFAAD